MLSYGYDFYYDIPEKSKVGGIGIFIKNSISHCIRSDLKLENVDSLEDLWLEANVGHSKYIIGGIYRHPNHSLDQYMLGLEKTLAIISKQKYSCIIAGDINIDLSKFNINKNTQEYLQLLLTYNFLPRIILPTRITSTNATLIDHIYYYERPSNGYKSTETLAGNIIADITDHLPNFFVIRCKSTEKVGKINRPMIRLFTTKNKNNFKNDIAETNWGPVLQGENIDVNSACNKFINEILMKFEKHFPKVRLSNKGSKDKPWITRALKVSSQHKITYTKNGLIVNHLVMKTIIEGIKKFIAS